MVVPLPSPLPPHLTSPPSFVPSSFNDSLSQYLLLFSSAAYSTSPSTCLASKLPSPTFQVTHSFNATLYGSALYGFAGIDHSTPPSIVFSFQGSMSYTQLYEELQHESPIPPINSTTLLANSYFWSASQLLLPAVSAALRNLTSTLFPSTPSIFFTGHSLGAALATVLAYLLVTSTPPPPSIPILYTFGEPRIGNYPMSQALSLALPLHYRVVHWRDVVPHLPPCPTTVDPLTRATVCSASNGTARYYAYHSPLEVLYSEAMPQWGRGGGRGVKVVECHGSPVGEDQTCGNAFDSWSVEDHEVYYQVDVGTFCLTPPELATTRPHPLHSRMERR